MSPSEIHAGVCLSFVVPVHNEAPSLRELHRAIVDVCMKNAYDYELILVDDGSEDDGFRVMEELAALDRHLRVIQFRRNFGQTAALCAGIDASTYPYIITLDADLQNDPQDVPLLLSTLDKGYDVVSGWRKNRKDNWLRRLPSRIANALISRVTGVRLSDYGCTLKVYRREYLHDVPLYGEMHRFIPVLAAWRGARVTEIAVHHAPRRYGRSHYGIGRTSRVILDLLTVKFLHTYVSRPMHFFGGSGMWLMGGGILAGLLAFILKIAGIRDFVSTPLPLASVFLLTVGVQCLLMGLLAELLIRVYFEQPGKHPYHIHRDIPPR